MTNLLGSRYQIVTQDGAPIVLENPPGSSDLAIGHTSDSDTRSPSRRKSVKFAGVTNESPLLLNDIEKTTEDYLFQIYVGSLTVVGLFILFRMISKSH